MKSFAFAFALCFASLSLALGCSSSSDNGAPADTNPAGDSNVGGDSTTDTSTTDSSVDSTKDSGGEIVPASTCGDPPYVNVTVHATDYSSKAPVVGAQLNASICPGSTFVSDSTGTFNGQIAKGKAFDPRFSDSTHVTMRLGEEKLDADFTANIPLLPEALTLVLPDWATDKPTTLAIVATAASLDGGVDADASGPCGKDGIVIAVTGHPEAKVVYFKDGSIPSPDATLTATTTAGLAEIAGLPTSAAPIQFTGTKSGCTVTFATPPLTGNYSLENGVLTVATGVVAP